MKIIIITPAEPGSKAGNRATAERWKSLLGNVGHRVSVVTEYRGEPCDALVALHAWRSVRAIRQFRKTRPEKPLIVALTGTDIYRHQQEFPQDTLYSITEADALIGLHELVANDIPAQFATKLSRSASQRRGLKSILYRSPPRRMQGSACVSLAT